jgi:hypothetical protein
LAQAGFAPEYGGAQGGFLLIRWYGGARPVSDPACARELLITTLTAYLKFLVQRYPEPDSPGLRPSALLAMLETNATALLGPSAALSANLARLKRELPILERSHSPVITDSRLDSHEWLYLSEGRILKSDAAQHWRSHDPIGCQDPAWDVAGAVCELALCAAEEERLWAELASASRRDFPIVKRQFYRLAYLAFRAAFAACVAAELAAWPDDARRLSRVQARYLAQLSASLRKE